MRNGEDGKLTLPKLVVPCKTGRELFKYVCVARKSVSDVRFPRADLAGGGVKQVKAYLTGIKWYSNSFLKIANGKNKFDVHSYKYLHIKSI